jgi:hypothetical protein
MDSSTFRQHLLEAEQIAGELKARRAIQDPLYWLQQCTRTQDEQDLTGTPYKPFPDWAYFRPLLQALHHEPVLPILKSRTMMASWLVAGWATHLALTRPATKAVFQSVDEDRAVNDVGYGKILWEQSLPELKERWKLAKALLHQPYNRFVLANGSELVGIPGDPDKIRSEHPTIYVMEEAQKVGSEAMYNVAVATRAPHIVLIGTGGPGFFNELVESAHPIDWPEYA